MSSKGKSVKAPPSSSTSTKDEMHEDYGTIYENSLKSSAKVLSSGKFSIKDETNIFVYSRGLTSAEAEAALLEHGLNTLPENKTPKWYIFISLFWQPMPIMIWLAVIVEAAISNYIDMAILLVIQFANASIAFYEANQAGDAVDALKASLRPIAQVKRDGKWINIDATHLVPGDLITLSGGGAVPADCQINDGKIEIDTSQLTGESLPVMMTKGGDRQPLMGSTVARGEVEATVENTGAKTSFGTTASLLQVTLFSNTLATLN